MANTPTLLVQPRDRDHVDVVIDKNGGTPARFTLTRREAIELANLIHEALHDAFNEG